MEELDINIIKERISGIFSEPGSVLMDHRIVVDSMSLKSSELILVLQSGLLSAENQGGAKEFIEKRLIELENTIDSINILSSDFKRSNNIFKPETQTYSVLTNIEEINQTLFSNSLQVELANTIINELNKPKIMSLLPTNIGLESDNINQLINQFNRIIIEQNNLLNDATEKNPLYIQFQDQLTEIKINILRL